MPERSGVVVLVDRLVRESRIPTARGREELRRELMSHFEEVGDSPEALSGALDRFGSAAAITEAFRRAYRPGRLALYLGKVVASIVVSSTIALVLGLTVNLRFGAGSDLVRLAPGHATTAVYMIAVVLVAVAAWELGIEPLCARLERRPVRLITTLVALSAGAYLTHAAMSTLVDPGRAFVASGLTIAVWISTIAILSRFDLAFLRLFGGGATK